MKYRISFFHCGDYLKKALATEIDEVKSIVRSIQWSDDFKHSEGETSYNHQTGYNRAFKTEFQKRDWEYLPLLRSEPKLIGDFRKGLVFVEIQFGNSATLYRDYYKFQYGLANGLLSFAVLIVPINPKKFFPIRPESVQNMADYSLANTCFSILPINVPTMLVGLLPEN